MLLLERQRFAEARGEAVKRRFVDVKGAQRFDAGLTRTIEWYRQLVQR